MPVAVHGLLCLRLTSAIHSPQPPVHQSADSHMERD